jgi:hypothetical protein
VAKTHFHHLEVHPAENGYVIEHHFIKRGPGRPSMAMNDYPNHKEQHVVPDAEAAATHVKNALQEYGEPEGSPEEENSETSAQEVAEERDRVEQRHRENNPMGSKKVPIRQY